MTRVYDNERDVELPWLYAQPITYPALDVGCHESVYILPLNDKGGIIDGIDVRPHDRPGLRTFYQDDIRTWQAPHTYPTVIALSTVEHVGLASEPYGTTADDPEGDRRAIEGSMRAVSPGGVLLLTVPFGEAGEFGWWRRYDTSTLDRLLDGYQWSAEYKFSPSWDVKGVALITVRA